MARTFSTEAGVTRYNGYRLNPANLIIDLMANGRWGAYTHSDIADLLEDLEKGIGIETPIHAEPHTTKEGIKTLKLTAGYRRTLAVIRFNEVHANDQGFVPYLLDCIVDDEGTEWSNLEKNARENVHRKTLTYMDKAEIVRRAQTLGKTLEEAGTLIKQSAPQASQLLKLLALDPRIQQMIHDGAFSMDNALMLSKLTPERQEKEVAKILSGVNTLESAVEEETPEAPATPMEPAEQEPVRESTKPDSVSSALRQAARDEGNHVALKMKELKEALGDFIKGAGPASNQGFIGICLALGDLISGEITPAQFENRGDKLCKDKVV